MQAPCAKRRRRDVDNVDIASTSAGLLCDAFASRDQLSYRAALLRSRNTPVFTSDPFDQPLRSPFYSDLGTRTEVCEFCGALFWLEERLTSFPRSVRPRYNKCCKSGRVQLQFPMEPPQLLRDLFADNAFMTSIRTYNSMFAMTSFGATVDESINQGAGPYVFKVAGQVSHWLGSLCPSPGDQPRFLQLYIFDPDNEVQNRLRFFNGGNLTRLRPEIVSDIATVLAAENEYVRLFKSARELCMQHEVPDFSIALYSRVTDRRYDVPSANSIGAIVYDGHHGSEYFDIIIRSKDNTPHRVSYLHSSYMPLQYPLLFPRGEPGWSPELLLTGDPAHDEDATTEDSVTSVDQQHRMTLLMFYSYQLHDRHDVYTHLLRASRLFQQYLVDAYISVEHSRLQYIRQNQGDFRCELLEGIHDAISRGDIDVSEVGKRIFLPSSFTGGPRYMYKHYQDALALCRVYGNPQYFITFTCNVRWPEIAREIARLRLSNAQDRPDIIARVFQMKVRSFIKYLRTAKPFGEITADLYTIEFQKRGLPHCHTLIWVSQPYCIREPEQVDCYISAELPDPLADPVLHHIVTNFMVHGPCGTARMNSPCYIHYKRTSESHPFLKNGIPIDNSFVVPYNPKLLLRFDAHINVEYCGWSMMIKYLFKYISKGVDRIRCSLPQSNSNIDTSSTDADVIVDEIRNFVDARFICPHEAAWRIFAFPIHHRNPPVQILAVHLEGKQNLTFKQSARLPELANNSNAGKTTLTEWFVSNRKEASREGTSTVLGHDLRYVDYLTKFRWDSNAKKWTHRLSKRTPPVGRLSYVHPSCGELFYLRLLLTYQRGCCSYADVRTVDNVPLKTFREACEKLGLIGNDKEWHTTISEAAEWGSSKGLRLLFVYLLLFCDVSNPLKLWEESWKFLSDDISYNVRRISRNTSASTGDDELQQLVLQELETILNSNSTPRSLADFGLPLPDVSAASVLQNNLLLEEKIYDRNALRAEHEQLHSTLCSEQLAIYDIIIHSVKTCNQVLAFVYGHGGTGKTYLWKTIISALRSTGDIVLAVAASGIASLLLPAGRTAHSRFKIPIELTEESVCHIKKKTNLSQLLVETTLIIWDEAPMSDRRCFEALDKTLQDLMGDTSRPFGGKSLLLGGDFRQTLPVRPKCTKAEIIDSCLPRSYIWKHFTVFKLSQNMRLSTATSTAAAPQQLLKFADWLLRIGDGVEGDPVHPHQNDNMRVSIPPDYLLPNEEGALQTLIEFIYDPSILHHPTPGLFAERAIITPKNASVDQINDMVLQVQPGDSVTYLSTDSMVPHSKNAADTEAMYPPEYLNVLNFSGIPQHTLQLKKGTPIMLMRNMDQKNGLCNGTRLLVSNLLPRVIEAQIITGTCIGNRVYIPRINFVHNSKDLPFAFTRRQFPVKVCYAMTVNKSQGQSLKRVGVYLPEPIFSHGQLYVALSRATAPDSLKILIANDNETCQNTTLNIVYKDLLNVVNITQL